MRSRNTETLGLRMDIQGIVITELCRALPAKEAQRTARSIVQQVMARFDQQPISEVADKLIASDLAAMLAALQR